MKTKYVKLFEEYYSYNYNQSEKRTLLTDPVEITAWIDSWSSRRVDVGSSVEDTRLQGTYTINENGVVDVEGSVNLESNGLKFIPIQFGKVSENFYCQGNPLVSLKGVPFEVGKHFSCQRTHIITLEYLPKIGGLFLMNGTINLITNAHNSTYNKSIGLAEFKRRGNISQITNRYIEYLSNDCPDVEYSLSWLQEVDNELYNQMASAIIEYGIEHQIESITSFFSDRVKNVYTKIGTQNKRMPLL